MEQPQGRVRRTREFWSQLIEEYEREGGKEKHEVFATRHEVRWDAFRQWLYRIRAEKRTASEPQGQVRLLPVRVVGSAAAAATITLEVAGVTLRVAADVDPKQVAALAIALRAGC